MALKFSLEFDPAYGRPVTVAPLVARVTAPNPGPFTFHGTNTYLVGDEELAVIDPGPDDEAHFAALVGAIASRPVSRILVSHTHRDHSPLAARLARALRFWQRGRIARRGLSRAPRRSTAVPTPHSCPTSVLPMATWWKAAAGRCARC